MESPTQENAIDPYQPPTLDDSSEAIEGVAALKDPRLLGGLALAAISIQCVASFVMFVYPFASKATADGFQVGYGAALILSIILFLRWIHVIASNTRRINPLTTHDPAWCVGGYFVPVVNWVIPCTHMRSFIRECHPQRVPDGMQGVAVVWWASFVLRGIAGRILPSGGLGHAQAWVWVIGTVLSWVSVSFLVSRISRRHFEFRWSELPASRRPRMLAGLAKPPLRTVAPSQSASSGASLPPRRPAMRPVPIAEQNRLTQETPHVENPDPAVSQPSVDPH